MGYEDERTYRPSTVDVPSADPRLALQQIAMGRVAADLESGRLHPDLERLPPEQIAQYYIASGLVNATHLRQMAPMNDNQDHGFHRIPFPKLSADSCRNVTNTDGEDKRESSS